MSDTTEFLGQVPMFALLDERDRAILADRIDVVRYPKGAYLFHLGDPGDSLYVVCTGEVELFIRNDTGDKIVLETARHGDFFGEISLLDGGSRNSSALVTSDLEALVVDRGDLDEFLRMHPGAAMDLLAATGRRLRETSRLLRHTASRNINEETEDQRSLSGRIADFISDFSGSMPFLFLHILFFAVWIGLNEPPLVRSEFGGFDPFPFGLLTMVVSLEAIVLSVFVLLSQNRQVARDRVRNDIEYQVNLKAELEIAHMHQKLDHMNAELLARLARIERPPGTRATARSEKAHETESRD